MPRKNELTWSELRVGVFVLAGILVVMLGIFYVTGTGFLGAKYRLVTYLPEVDGLTTGARVTLDGVEVGNVDSIQVARPQAGEVPNQKRSVEVVIRVNRDFQERHPHRLDSRAAHRRISRRPRRQRAARLYRHGSSATGRRYTASRRKP